MTMPADALNAEDIHAEAANLIRSLVDRIVLTLNNQDGLDIDLCGDLTGILTLAANKYKLLDKSDLSVQHVKVVAGARNHWSRLFSAIGLQARCIKASPIAGGAFKKLVQHAHLATDLNLDRPGCWA